MPYFGIPIRNGLPIGLGSVAALSAVQLFSPSSLFAGGVEGTWYDPSDRTTLFQDSAGTTPVTAVEQPVGLMLDKSKGLVLGSELITSSWAVTGAGISQSGGVITFASSPSTDYAENTGGVVSGKGYIAEFTVTGYSGSGGVSFMHAGNSIGIVATANGRYRQFFYATSTGVLGVRARLATTTAVVSNISVRELPGNHAFQATSTSRPVLSARYNLLLSTETLATQSVATAATTQRLRLEGTGSITLSGTATGTYSAGSHTFSTTAGTLTLTVSGSVTKADLRAANDALNQPAYQRVNTATDYDTTGFKPYLRFDGTDDFLVTNSIDFTSTDKMTVFAGVRKLSDAAIATVLETSTDANANSGAFEVRAPAGALNDFFARFRGTGASFVSSPVAAPATRVITAVDDISADNLILRLNGTQVGNSTADQGTGNFGNYPMYIGRRAGTSQPFNGRIYGLIVRGAQSTAQQITNTENWLNQRTGAY